MLIELNVIIDKLEGESHHRIGGGETINIDHIVSIRKGFKYNGDHECTIIELVTGKEVRASQNYADVREKVFKISEL
jgi:hypothetical protein